MASSPATMEILSNHSHCCSKAGQLLHGSLVSLYPSCPGAAIVVPDLESSGSRHPSAELRQYKKQHKEHVILGDGFKFGIEEVRKAAESGDSALGWAVFVPRCLGAGSAGAPRLGQGYWGVCKPCQALSQGAAPDKQRLATSGTDTVTFREPGEIQRLFVNPGDLRAQVEIVDSRRSQSESWLEPRTSRTGLGQDPAALWLHRGFSVPLTPQKDRSPSHGGGQHIPAPENGARGLTPETSSRAASGHVVL